MRHGDLVVPLHAVTGGVPSCHSSPAMEATTSHRGGKEPVGTLKASIRKRSPQQEPAEAAGCGAMAREAPAALPSSSAGAVGGDSEPGAKRRRISSDGCEVYDHERHDKGSGGGLGAGHGAAAGSLREEVPLLSQQSVAPSAAGAGPFESGSATLESPLSSNGAVSVKGVLTRAQAAARVAARRGPTTDSGAAKADGFGAERGVSRRPSGNRQNSGARRAENASRGVSTGRSGQGSNPSSRSGTGSFESDPPARVSRAGGAAGRSEAGEPKGTAVISREKGDEGGAGRGGDVGVRGGPAEASVEPGRRGALAGGGEDPSSSGAGAAPAPAARAESGGGGSDDGAPGSDGQGGSGEGASAGQSEGSGTGTGSTPARPPQAAGDGAAVTVSSRSRESAARQFADMAGQSERDSQGTGGSGGAVAQQRADGNTYDLATATAGPPGHRDGSTQGSGESLRSSTRQRAAFFADNMCVHSREGRCRDLGNVDGFRDCRYCRQRYHRVCSKAAGCNHSKHQARYCSATCREMYRRVRRARVVSLRGSTSHRSGRHRTGDSAGGAASTGALVEAGEAHPDPLGEGGAGGAGDEGGGSAAAADVGPTKSRTFSWRILEHNEAFLRLGE